MTDIHRLRELAYRELERVEDEQALVAETADSDRPRREGVVGRDRVPRAIFSEVEHRSRFPIS